MKRLTPALLTVIMLLFVGGLVVAYVAKNLLARDVPVAEDPRVVVPVAVADLKPGTEITAAHLATAPYRQSRLDPAAVRSDVVILGRVVRTPIKAAEPILTTQLYPPGENPPLPVSPNMRAMSISLNDGTAVVDGLVRPGQYVDLHFTPTSFPDSERTGGMTMTLFKGVKVLAINRSTNGSAGRGGNSAVLEVTPQQVNILTQAQQKGLLNLTYTPDGKGDGGVTVSDDERATLEEILGLTPPAQQVTEVFNGTGRSVMSFRNGVRDDQYGLLNYDYNTNRTSSRLNPAAPLAGVRTEPTSGDTTPNAGPTNGSISQNP